MYWSIKKKKAMKKLKLVAPIVFVLLSACNNDTKKEPVTGQEAASVGTTENNNTGMKGYKINIEEATKENDNYRKVLYTGEHMQLVLMSLNPKEEIGMETHKDSDQFFRFESGKGKCIVNGTEYAVGDGDAVLIPAGASHNVINTDATQDLKLYTIYAKPNHKDGIVRKTKEEADKNEEKFDGKTTETE